MTAVFVHQVRLGLRQEELRLMESRAHEPVMVAEILASMGLERGMNVLDATVGLGGHSEVFLSRICPGGTLVGTEWDEQMLAQAERRLHFSDCRVVLRRTDFRAAPAILDELGLRVHGALFDLGLNSAQIDDPSRGLSFREDGPLDMRQDRTSGEPASALLNRWTAAQIERALREYGDERFARRIAARIVETRKRTPLRTTKQLADCVTASIPRALQEKRIHPATRTFQAIRIAVNREFDGLGEAIAQVAHRLSPGGVLVVLSYHSGEDRIVKNLFRDLSREGYATLYEKPLQPSESEQSRNPRSRSAKLRAIRAVGGES